jgi:hypothetical protein
MHTSLQHEFVVVETSDAVCYELPAWQAGQDRRATMSGALGVGLLVLGLACPVPFFVVAWAGGLAMSLTVASCFLAFACPIMLAGLTLINYSLSGAPMRNRIELTAIGIEAIRLVGPFRRSRRFAWGEVARLEIVPAQNVPGYTDVEDGFLLQVVRDRGRPVTLAGDNDRVRLLALAGELARRAKVLRAASADSLMLAPPSPLDVVEEVSREVVADRDEQPAGSTAILEQHADGVTITVPPLGLRGFIKDRSFAGSLLVGVILTAFIAVGATPAVARDGIVGLFTFTGSIVLWPCALFVTVMLAYFLSRGARLSARGSVLTVQWTNLLGNHCRIWRRDELADVRVVSELVDSGEGKVWKERLDIQLHDTGSAAPRYLLHWREKAELEWIATTLRRSLRLLDTQPKPKDAKQSWDDELA